MGVRGDTTFPLLMELHSQGFCHFGTKSQVLSLKEKPREDTLLCLK